MITHSKLIVFVTSMVVALGLMTLAPSTAQADTYRRNTSDGHVLRLLAYVAHPIGIGLEYCVTRPMHALASQDDFDILMGHKARVTDADYFEWTHGDRSPGIRDVKMDILLDTSTE
jgi:hypothetical protein